LPYYVVGTAGGTGGILFAQVLGFAFFHIGFSSAFIPAALVHPMAAITLFPNSSSLAA